MTAQQIPSRPATCQPMKRVWVRCVTAIVVSALMVGSLACTETIPEESRTALAQEVSDFRQAMSQDFEVLSTTSRDVKCGYGFGGPYVELDFLSVTDGPSSLDKAVKLASAGGWTLISDGDPGANRSSQLQKELAIGDAGLSIEEYDYDFSSTGRSKLTVFIDIYVC